MATMCLLSVPYFYPLLLGLGLDFGFLFVHIYIHDDVVVVANDTSACYGNALLVAAFAIVFANEISIA
jgi:hypothetical protein